MPHSPIMAFVGTVCSLHQKISKCLWDILPQKRDLMVSIKENYSMANEGSCQQKGHLKAIWKNCSQIKSGKPLERLLQILISSLALGSQYFSSFDNCNSTNDKYGKFQKSSFCIPYGSAKSQTFVNSVHFTFGTGEDLQAPLSLKYRF